jgi:SAM-dependent methyltransferase
MRCWESGLRPGVGYEIIERDDGHVHAMDMARLFSPNPTDWKLVERVACEHVEGRVLDVGCGVGRHAVLFAEKGYVVVGPELSPGAAAVSRARGEGRGGHGT